MVDSNPIVCDIWSPFPGWIGMSGLDVPPSAPIQPLWLSSTLLNGFTFLTRLKLPNTLFPSTKLSTLMLRYSTLDQQWLWRCQHSQNSFVSKIVFYWSYVMFKCSEELSFGFSMAVRHHHQVCLFIRNKCLTYVTDVQYVKRLFV